jgi:hemerythrin-like domain-containing protein
VGLIDDLIGDHRQVLELLGRAQAGEAGADSDAVDEAVRLLSTHAAAEEMVLYPAARDLVPAGSVMVGGHLEEHGLVKGLLATIERSSGPDRVVLVGSVLAYVRHHARHEEQVLLPALQRHASDEQLADIGRAFTRAKAAAPTHPHPHAPNQPPGIFPAGAAAALIDRVRDAVSGRAR